MLRGVIPAFLTPFADGGARIDVAGIGRLADHLAPSGVFGVFVTGTTGEFISLDPSERRLMISETMRAIAGRIPVLAHVGSFNTAEAVALAKYAVRERVAGIATLPPYFHPSDDDAQFAYFSAVCEAADGLPVFLYHLPAFAGNEVSLSTIERLKNRYSNLAGIKDSSGDMERLRAEVAMGLPDFDVVCGSDENTARALELGAVASVTSTANTFPEVFLDVHRAFEAGDTAGVRAAQDRLTALSNGLYNGRLLAAYKEALRLRGVDVGTVRPPQRPLTPAERSALADALHRLNLID